MSVKAAAIALVFRNARVSATLRAPFFREEFEDVIAQSVVLDVCGGVGFVLFGIGG